MNKRDMEQMMKESFSDAFEYFYGKDEKIKSRYTNVNQNSYLEIKNRMFNFAMEVLMAIDKAGGFIKIDEYKNMPIYEFFYICSINNLHFEFRRD